MSRIYIRIALNRVLCQLEVNRYNKIFFLYIWLRFQLAIIAIKQNRVNMFCCKKIKNKKTTRNAHRSSRKTQSNQNQHEPVS